MFYNMEIELWKKGISSKSSIGQTIYSPPIFVKKMMVDVQPYSSEEARRDYGFTIECTKRMFCDIEDFSIGSNIIKYKNKDYNIVKIPWDDEHMEVILNAIWE